jgi:hypothetical protein
MITTVGDLRRFIVEALDDTRAQALGHYSDVHKEIYGVRPHGQDLSGMSVAEIEEEIDKLYRYGAEQRDDDFDSGPDPFCEPDMEPDEYEHVPMRASMSGARQTSYRRNVTKHRHDMMTGRKAR